MARKLAILAVLAATAVPLLAQAASPTCIDLEEPQNAIDHTRVVDAKTVLFYLRSGTILKNTLKQGCPGLLLHGFEFVTPMNQLCDNSQSIRVLQTGAVCELGTFSPYTPPQAPAAH